MKITLFTRNSRQGSKLKRTGELTAVFLYKTNSRRDVMPKHVVMSEHVPHFPIGTECMYAIKSGRDKILFIGLQKPGRPVPWPQGDFVSLFMYGVWVHRL